MDYREFGRTGVKVSALGMGTFYDVRYMAGAALGIRSGWNSKLAALRTGIEAGINLIDTAEVYRTEKLVAEAIRGVRRDNLFIATKVSPWHLRFGSLIKAAERSIKRLGCSWIDLYQIHRPNPVVPLEETMRAMSKLVDEGKIRHVGVSNLSMQQTKKAREALSRCELASVQVEYNLVSRRIENDLLPYCEKNAIAVLAYRPVAHGALASPGGRLATRMEQIGSRYGGKTPAQIAVNWLLNRRKCVFPIPRASGPGRVSENVGAVGWALSLEDMERLESASRSKPF